jgi:acyl dehydratase
MAAMGGFDKPILHGMCFYGIATKGALEKFGNNDPKSIFAVQARFTSHVFPGETLVFNYWKQGSNILYSGTTKERGLECIIGVIELKN